MVIRRCLKTYKPVSSDLDVTEGTEVNVPSVFEFSAEYLSPVADGFEVHGHAFVVVEVD
jgi:hypothetical protein